MHNPTSVNRQGWDVGSQYRSAIFYLDENQRKTAEKVIKELDQSGKYHSPIATEIVPAKEFYRAEEYHQQYYAKQGYNRS
jgi:methionine-S-sulfoxide reductase